MFEKFQNKYKVDSTRLPEWDYSNNGYYFVTICVKDKKCVLGEIRDEKIVLSKIGEKVKQCWLEIPKHFPLVTLDEYVVMPNHIHGIVEITSNGYNNFVENPFVETCHGMSLRNNVNQFSKPKSQSISMIINHFKGSIKRWCNHNNVDFSWQPRFYDHIIRDDEELTRIREYVINNPLKPVLSEVEGWELDKNNVENIDRKIFK